MDIRVYKVMDQFSNYNQMYTTPRNRYQQNNKYNINNEDILCIIFNWRMEHGYGEAIREEELNSIFNKLGIQICIKEAKWKNFRYDRYLNIVVPINRTSIHIRNNIPFEIIMSVYKVLNNLS